MHDLPASTPGIGGGRTMRKLGGLLGEGCTADGLDTISMEMVSLGFKASELHPLSCWHSGRGLRVVVLFDWFTCTGASDELRWLLSSLKAKCDLKQAYGMEGCKGRANHSLSSEAPQSEEEVL